MNSRITNIALLRWLLLAGYVVILAIASLLPSEGEFGGGWDSMITPAQHNALHVPAYLLLILLAIYAMRSTEPLRWGRVGVLVILCVLFGALLECLQASFIPGRVGSLSDCLLNTLGVGAGVGVWRLAVALGGRIQRSDSRSRACETRGLAPSPIGPKVGHLVACEVPVPVYSQAPPRAEPRPGVNYD